MIAFERSATWSGVVVGPAASDTSTLGSDPFLWEPQHLLWFGPWAIVKNNPVAHCVCQAIPPVGAAYAVSCPTQRPDIILSPLYPFHAWRIRQLQRSNTAGCSWTGLPHGQFFRLLKHELCGHTPRAEHEVILESARMPERHLVRQCG